GVRGDEPEQAAEVRQVAGRLDERAVVEVVHDDRAGGGAVALPQLGAVGAVVGREIERAADRGQAGRRRRVGNGRQPAGPRNRAGVDVGDQGGAGGGAVALPEFGAVNAVVGGEEEGAADGGQVRRVGRGAAGVDVLDEDRAGGGAVGLPQLGPV